MLKRLQGNNGGAMLAALILMPVLAAGSLAAYQMANKSATVTMMAAMEEDAVFSSESVVDILIGDISNNAGKRDQIVDAAADAWLFNTSTTTPATLIRQDTSPRYEKLATLYTVKKLPQSAMAEGAEANTIAIEITTRTYNTANPSWNTSPNVEHVTQQEFNMGLVKVGGCAANYDFFAENEYKKTVFFSMGFGANAAFYAGNKWSSSGFDFSMSHECIDTPGDAYKYFLIFPINICPWSRVDCNITPPITFENALYGKSDSNQNGQTDDHDAIHKVNINGNDGNPYASTYPYPFNSMEKTIIDHISKNARSATTHAAAFAAMNDDGDVGKVGTSLTGYWYFRDTNNNGVPDIDSPYFYHEGTLTDAFPFNMGMFRFRNTYVYVNGHMNTFQMGSGTGMNSGQLYLIASGDVKTLQMMNMTMADAGLVVLAGGSITNTAMMSGSGIGSGTMMANNNINLKKGMSMSFFNRQRLLAKHDIEEFSGFSMSMGSTGTGTCGCTAGTADETTEMQIGRRFSKS
ncbi:MAG: hypothetical protein ABIJ50_09750 [Pseudomonadota bacterium]